MGAMSKAVGDNIGWGSGWRTVGGGRTHHLKRVGVHGLLQVQAILCLLTGGGGLTVTRHCTLAQHDAATTFHARPP